MNASEFPNGHCALRFSNMHGGGKANEFTGTETEVQVLNVMILSLQLIQTWNKLETS